MADQRSVRTAHAGANVSGDQPRFSLIVPAHNEELCLPRLLDSVERARATYRGGAGAVEVIVADNASTDSTRQVAEFRGCRVVSVEKRAIAAVRNGGARLARGDLLAFVDADAKVHPDLFNELDLLLADDATIGGATGIRFERQSVGLRCTYGLLVLTALALRGFRTIRPLSVDGGVVFCRRRDFDELGGYREDLLFAEDVHFLLALGRLGRSRGQRLISGTRTPTTFSTRKFDRYGDWHYFRMPFRIAWSVFTGRDAWVRDYWYETRR